MSSEETLHNLPLRLALVENEGLLRDLLKQVLESAAGFQVLGAFAEAESALCEIPKLKLDVAVLDIHLGDGMTGIELGIALRKTLPELGFVLLSNQRDLAVLMAIPASQAHGWSYLHKSSVADVATLSRAIRGAAAGEVVLDAEVASQLVRGRKVTSELSERAREVLALVAQGYSNGAIAQRLSLSEKSIEGVLTRLYRQLDLDTSDAKVHPRVRATLHYLGTG